jgi:hypothetical protein
MLNFFRARLTDPATSHAAADAAKDFVPAHYTAILDVLKHYGPMGKDGIAACGLLEANQIARRLKEMQKLGLIMLTGRLVKSKANRDEREWVASKE